MTIKTFLYNKKVELLFDSFRHTYTVTDPDKNIFSETRPSATTALGIINKPMLVGWAANITADTIKAQLEPGKSYDEIELDAIVESGRKAHRQRKEEAGALGTITHKWVEDYIKGKNPGVPVNEKLRESIQKFLDWVEEHKVKFLLSEQQVYSRKYQYTGTLDFICQIDGKMYIGDLKTSSGIYAEMLLQTSAYRYARVEEYPNEVYSGQIIVRIDKKDGELEIGMVTDDMWYKKMFTAFVYALELYKANKIIDTFTIERALKPVVTKDDSVSVQAVAA